MEDDLEEAKQASIKKRRRLAGAAKASKTKKKKITDLQDRIVELEAELSKFTRPDLPATLRSAEEDQRPDLSILEVMQRLSIFMQETDLKFDVFGHYGRSLLQLRNTTNIVYWPHNIYYKAIRLILEDLS